MVDDVSWASLTNLQDFKLLILLLLPHRLLSFTLDSSPKILNFDLT
jgi:hypothetical protein